jgi:cytosine/adenosine deaminase-related metal-dependent hydrolase
VTTPIVDPLASSAEAPETRPTPLPGRRELLIRGAYVVTMDDRLGELPRGDVHVRDGVIVDVAPTLREPGCEVIDGTGRIVLPGFVDTHWHLWNSALRGLIDHTPEHSYFPVKHALGPLYRPGDTYRSTRLALAEAVSGGITTVHDWDHNVRSPADAAASIRAHLHSGLRVRFGYGTPDGLPADVLMDLEDLSRVRDTLPALADGRLTLGVVLRGPARTTEPVYRREWAAARELGLPISMHLGGDRTDASRYAPMETLHRHGLLGPDVQLVHAVQATDEELSLVARTGTTLTVSPITSLRSMGFPRITAALAAGVSLSLSTDTLAGPTAADTFAQMKVAYSVARSLGDHVLDQRRVLRLTTIDAARGLGLADITGSISPGKRADLQVIRATDANLAPCADPVAVLVNAGSPANVETVIADGRVLKWDGRLVADDPLAIARDASLTLRSLCVRAGWDPPWSPFPA